MVHRLRAMNASSHLQSSRSLWSGIRIKQTTSNTWNGVPQWSRSLWSGIRARKKRSV